MKRQSRNGARSRARAVTNVSKNVTLPNSTAVEGSFCFRNWKPIDRIDLCMDGLPADTSRSLVSPSGILALTHSTNVASREWFVLAELGWRKFDCTGEEMALVFDGPVDCGPPNDGDAPVGRLADRTASIFFTVHFIQERSCSVYYHDFVGCYGAMVLGDCGLDTRGLFNDTVTCQSAIRIYPPPVGQMVRSIRVPAGLFAIVCVIRLLAYQSGCLKENRDRLNNSCQAKI
jgi:hypothetical protein